MNNEFYEHKRSDAVKWVIVFVLIAVLLGGMVAALVFAVPSADESQETKAPLENEALDENAPCISTEIENGDRIMLTAGAVAYSAADNTVSKTLTATVTPDDAADTSVDWSVAWEDEASRGEEAVTDYVTVTPESDGALVATVTCHKAFEGDRIIITVTTRMGGFSAVCFVEYKGVPSALKIDTAGYQSVTDSSWGVQLIDIGCGETALFDLSLENIFGSVGAEFNNYTVTLEAHGSITVGVEAYDADGNHTGSSTQTFALEVADLMDKYGYSYTFFQKSGGMHSHVEVRLEDGKLQIEGLDAISAYSAIAAGRTGRAEYSFKDYVDGKIPYVTVTVTEQNSGVSASVNIRTYATVESVSLSTASLTF